MKQPVSEASRIFGERLRSARLRLGISQEDLGDLADIHFTSIGKFERGLSNPTLSTLVKLARPLGVDAGSWLEGLTPDMVDHEAHGVTAADLIAARAKSWS